MVSYDNMKDKNNRLILKLGDFEVLSVGVYDKVPSDSMLSFHFKTSFYEGTRRIVPKTWVSYEYMKDEYEIEKKVWLLPKKVRENMYKEKRRGEKRRYFKEIPEELSIIEDFLTEWLNLYRFCMGTKGIEDYLGMWHLTQFVEDMFEKYVVLRILLKEQMRDDKVIVKLGLKNDAEFKSVEDDAHWITQVDESKFDNRDDYINYKMTYTEDTVIPCTEK